MWFLMKCAFWLSVVVLLLPAPDAPNQQQVSSAQAVSALTAALNDVRGFCGRNPEACAAGTAAVQGFGHKAQHGARMLHDFISQQLEATQHLTPPPGSRAPEPSAGGTPVSATPGAAFRTSGVDTLRAEDRTLPWRGPSPVSAERG